MIPYVRTGRAMMVDSQRFAKRIGRPPRESLKQV
jgi:hypothetical protein